MIFSILGDTLNGLVDLERLNQEVVDSEISVAMNRIGRTGDTLTFEFDGILTSQDESLLVTIVGQHTGSSLPVAKINLLYPDTNNSVDFKDLDYTIKNLFPKRTFIKGELEKVEWFFDQGFTDLYIKADMDYERDAFGFAIKRTTTRTWYDTEGNEIEDKKITTKIYSTLEKVKEGKVRRGNIVDGIQLPVMSFMVETMTEGPGEVVLIGRDFLDRHEFEFTKFIDNSSTVTDPNDVNFGKKKIVVAIELAANTTDTWLKNTPSLLGGATIEQYLVGEFSI